MTIGDSTSFRISGRSYQMLSFLRIACAEFTVFASEHERLLNLVLTGDNSPVQVIVVVKRKSSKVSTSHRRYQIVLSHVNVTTGRMRSAFHRFEESAGQLLACLHVCLYRYYREHTRDSELLNSVLEESLTAEEPPEYERSESWRSSNGHTAAAAQGTE